MTRPPAPRGVETIGIQWLHALLPGGPRQLQLRSCRAVPTPLPGSLEMEGDAKPKASADLELQIGKPRGGSRRCGKNPGPSPRATAGPEARARSRRQSHKETISSRFCPAPAEQPLALGQGRSLVLPTPNLSWGFSGDRPSMVEVDAVSRELLNSSAESGGPSFRTNRDGFFSCNPGPANARTAGSVPSQDPSQAWARRFLKRKIPQPPKRVGKAAWFCWGAVVSLAVKIRS